MEEEDQLYVPQFHTEPWAARIEKWIDQNNDAIRHLEHSVDCKPCQQMTAENVKLSMEIAKLKKRNKKLRRQLAHLKEAHRSLFPQESDPPVPGFDPALADVAAMFRAEWLRTEQEANGVH